MYVLVLTFPLFFFMNAVTGSAYDGSYARHRVNISCSPIKAAIVEFLQLEEMLVSPLNKLIISYLSDMLGGFGAHVLVLYCGNVCILLRSHLGRIII